jgi:hypothetical protein
MEHQDIGTGELSAVDASRHLAAPAQRRSIHVRFYCARAPDGFGASLGALEMVNRAVTLLDGRIGETGFLKVAVDVAREDKVWLGEGVSPVEQNSEPRVRCGLPVQAQLASSGSPKKVRPLEACS